MFFIFFVLSPSKVVIHLIRLQPVKQIKIGPEKTRNGSDVTIPTATVHPIMNRDDWTSMFEYKSSKYLNQETIAI